MSDAFNTLIDSLAKELGFDSSGELVSPVELTIDDLALTLAYDARSGEDDVLIYASLGTVALERELTVYRALLEGNLLWSATADATIGVNSATREALIAYRLPMRGIDGAGLARIVAHFSQVALGWREFVTAADQSDTPAAPPTMMNPGMLRA